MKIKTRFLFILIYVLGGCSSDPDTTQHLSKNHPPTSQQQVEPPEPIDDIPNDWGEIEHLYSPTLYTNTPKYKKSPLSTVSYLFTYNEETFGEILKTEKDVPWFQFASSFYPSLAPSMTITVSSLWAFPCKVKYKNISFSRDKMFTLGGLDDFISPFSTVPLKIQRILDKLNDLNGTYSDIPSEQTYGIEGGDVNQADGIEGGDVNELNKILSEEDSSFEKIWEDFFFRYYQENRSNPSMGMLNMIKNWNSTLPSSHNWLLGRAIKIYFSDNSDMEITLYVPGHLDLHAYFDNESSLKIDKIKLTTGIGIDMEEFAQQRKEMMMADIPEESNEEIPREILGLSIRMDDIKSITLPTSRIPSKPIDELCSEN